MNRCIQCYRCVRFYKDYAGGKDLDVYSAHDHVYFGREKDGILENEFSGNLAEICPTGVFTDKTLKQHYTRKWDMTMAPSICQNCSVGCNITPSERYGTLRQITNRYNGEVNGYFICDRGRFGYEYVNDINRIKQPLIRNQIPEVVGKHALYHHVQDILLNSKTTIGIGSPRASLESNFTLMQLVGKDNFYQGISANEAQMLRRILEVSNSGKVHVASIKEIEEADVVLILGEDPINTAPRTGLAIRQAVRKAPMDLAREVSIPPWNDAAVREIIQQEKGELFIANPTTTKLDEIAHSTFHASPDDIARFGNAIAYHVNTQVPHTFDMDREIYQHSEMIAQSLKTAKRPLIVSGTSTCNESIIKAAANIAYAIESLGQKASISFIVPESNSIGLAMMEAPSIQKAEERLQYEGVDTIIVLENDLYKRFKSEEVDRWFDHAKRVIVLDYLNNTTTQKADILIPSGTFAEADGTLVNNEGRAQSFFQVYMPKNENIRESWRWLHEFQCLKAGVRPNELVAPGELLNELVESMPQFKGAETVAPPNGFRIAGQKIPRQPHRYSGRTAMMANINVSEPKPPEDTDSALSFTMEGYRGIPPAPMIPFFWSPGWNSIQSLNKFQEEVGGHLKGGDPGKRLFKEDQRQPYEFFNHIPSEFKSKKGEYLVVWLYHIFGSEEMSMYTKGVKERAPKPYVALSKADAQRLDARDGEMIGIQDKERIIELPLIIKEELVEGTVGLPYNLPGIPVLSQATVGLLTGKEYE
jgi:NADH-quinone oxidoreductase subunit G